MKGDRARVQIPLVESVLNSRLPFGLPDHLCQQIVGVARRVKLSHAAALERTIDCLSFMRGVFWCAGTLAIQRDGWFGYL